MVTEPSNRPQGISGEMTPKLPHPVFAGVPLDWRWDFQPVSCI
ncbi:hypothetical protein [Actinomadura sp. KC216]|nr:hypothetical protein [Actinomadura sp. KC216]